MRLLNIPVWGMSAVMLGSGALVHATSTCDLNAYCVQMAGKGSYCKSYLTVPVCYGSKITCATCGTAVTTTKIPTTTLPSTTTSTKPSTTTSAPSTAKSVMTSLVSTTIIPTTTAIRTTTPSVTSTISTASTSTKLASSTASTTVAPTTKPVVTSTTFTTIMTSSSVASQVVGITCDAYCAKFLSGSYCKTWISAPSCSATNLSCGPDKCGPTSVIPQNTIALASTTLAPTTVLKSTTSSPVTDSQFTSVPSIVTPDSSQCELYSATEVPLFLWVEGPRMYARSEFVAFYQKVRVFLQSNCAHIRPTTLVIRTAHPYYVPRYEMEYWPPETSPLFTELLSKLNVGSPVNVLLYPYIFDDFSRSQWIAFANSGSVDKVLPRVSFDPNSPAADVLSNVNIYDGMFQFAKGWQKSVDKLGSNVRIDGFMIDYEEISRYPDSNYLVSFTADELNPYRSLYPTIKLGTAFGYDDIKKMAYFDPFIDYLHLEAYDLYYPYSGSDASADSLFLTYQDDPVNLAKILAQKVFTSSILSAYQTKLSKLYIMWSTQSLVVKDCLYKINDASCGVNNEFGSWRPDTFNTFIQEMKKTSSVMANVQHGVYTLNFVRPTWLPINARGMP